MSEDKLYSSLPGYIERTLHDTTPSQGTIQEFIQTIIEKSDDETERVLELKLTDKSFQLRNTNERKQGRQGDSRQGSSDTACPLALPPVSCKKKRRKTESKVSDLFTRAMPKFVDCQDMHALWDQYMSDLLSSSLGGLHEVLLTKLSKADYHGSMIKVVQATAPSMTGLSGLVLYESTNMFYILTPNDTLKSIPKRGTILGVEWRNLKFYIYGNHFRTSPAERSAKKFKSKNSIALQ